MGRTALKIVLGILGALGAVYAVVGVVQLIRVISTSDASNPYSTSQVAASIVPVCLGLIVCAACFRYVLKKDG